MKDTIVRISGIISSAGSLTTNIYSTVLVQTVSNGYGHLYMYSSISKVLSSNFNFVFIKSSSSQKSVPKNE